MDWTFGTVAWSMLAFFFLFTVIWMFIGVIADVLRRDLSGWTKAGWIVLLVLLPFIGLLAYVVARPRTSGDERGMVTEWRIRSEPSRSTEIAHANTLYEEGIITANEYRQLKHRSLTA